MSLKIPDHFRETYADSFRDVVQQKNSRLMKAVTVKRGLTGVGQQIDFVLPGEDEETTGQRFKKTVIDELDTDSRWYYPRTFQKATGEDTWDEKKLAPTVMPGGKHVNSAQRAFNLRCDRIIMENLLGDARTGKTGENITPLPATQIVPVDFVHTGSDTDSRFTVPKIIEAIRILKANEAWNEEERAMGVKLWGAIDASEEAFLKQQANASSGDRLFSKDYDPPVYAADGTLVSWLGINFINYERLLTGTATGASGTVNVKKIPIWTSTAFEFGIWSDFHTSVSIRSDLSDAVQFLSKYMIGGGREQDAKVVQVNALIPA